MSIPKGPTKVGSGGRRGHSQQSKPSIEDPEKLETEAGDLTRLLANKRIKKVWRHRPGEIGIEFTDGTRLFVNAHQPLDISVE